MDKRVVVGISGGVDSLMTAILLQERGYKVVGVNLVLWGEVNENPFLTELCQRMDIELVYADVRQLFKKKIIDSFVNDYLEGITPNPCAICNPLIKWETLKNIADERGIEKIATGHYIKIAEYQGNYYIYKGKDSNKDQSYFLWGLEQDILSRAITPLGEYRKEEVKQMAAEYGFKEIATKQESMSICFLQGKNYRDFIKTYTNKEINQIGSIKDRSGAIIGEHIGILNYTIGQKTGILNKQGLPLYVWDIDKENNSLIADLKENLFSIELYVKDVKWIDEKEILAENIEVKVRGIGLNPEGFAHFQWIGENQMKISLSSPAWAIAPGQPVAFYIGERLVGGGILSK